MVVVVARRARRRSATSASTAPPFLKKEILVIKTTFTLPPSFNVQRHSPFTLVSQFLYVFLIITNVFILYLGSNVVIWDGKSKGG